MTDIMELKSFAVFQWFDNFRKRFLKKKRDPYFFLNFAVAFMRAKFRH